MKQMDRPVWVDLLDPDEATLRAAIPSGVHASAVNRLLATSHHDDEPRPRLETHGNHLFGVLVVPIEVDSRHRLVFQEVDVLVTIDQFLTVRKSPPGCEPFSCDATRVGAARSQASPGMCLYALFDEIAERYLALVDRFDGEIDHLEEIVENGDATTVRMELSALRHDILSVRRALAPTRDAARGVLDKRVELEGDDELFPRETQLHFADAYDKLLRATDGLDLSRDLLAGVRDYHQAQIANDQNEVMKRLTVIASLLLLPTFIVGLYGMNVKGVPEYRFHYGYGFAWALILITTVFQVYFFRRKRWI
jgi:magnesium transporter